MILHCDLDSFFVSVEEAKNPALKRKITAVGGNVYGRGVIASASYGARQYGIRAGMPAYTALKICPALIIIDPDFRSYGDFSKRFFEILSSFSPDIEVMSVDEAYLDTKGMEWLFTGPRKIAEGIKAATKEKLGINVTIGGGSRKYIAKAASRVSKPDGLLLVEDEQAFIAELPVTRISQVGEKFGNVLAAMGIRTVRDVLSYDRDFWERTLGKKGAWLYDVASLGSADDICRSDPLPRSLGNSLTFASDLLFEKADEELKKLCGKVGRRLRRDGLRGRTVELTVRYDDFTTLTNSLTLSFPTDMSGFIYNAARGMFEKYSGYDGKFRLLGVTVSNISEALFDECDLWTCKRTERTRKIYTAIDAIQKKYPALRLDYLG